MLLFFFSEWVKRKHNLKILPSTSIAGSFTSALWVPTPTEPQFTFSSVRRSPELNITSSMATSSHILLSRSAPRTKGASSSVFAASTTRVLQTNASHSNSTVDPILLEKVSSRSNDDGSLGILGALLVWLILMEGRNSHWALGVWHPLLKTYNDPSGRLWVFHFSASLGSSFNSY